MKAKFSAMLMMVLGVLGACNGGDGGVVLGSDHVDGPAAPMPESGGGEEPTSPIPHSGSSGVGPTCRSSDSAKLCLALKYVVYKDSAGASVVSEAEAIQNLVAINGVWASCNLGFQIDEFAAIRPEDHGLRYRTSNYPELDDIRSEFGSPKALLVTTTGAWDRTGSLGNTGANAWTSLPSSGPFGAILERNVGTYPNIIGHELGHYLNLLHASDAANLMNAVIYTTSIKLSSAQCNTARSAARAFWSAMLR